MLYAEPDGRHTEGKLFAAGRTKSIGVGTSAAHGTVRRKIVLPAVTLAAYVTQLGPERNDSHKVSPPLGRSRAVNRLRPGIKQKPHRRSALPDRGFFACGACHIWAYAFLQKHPARGFEAFWIRPAEGFAGSHIMVGTGATAFDYHGYSRLDHLLQHTDAQGRRWWPGWSFDLIKLPAGVGLRGKVARVPRPVAA